MPHFTSRYWADDLIVWVYLFCLYFDCNQGEYYMRNFYMNGTLLPQSVPNLIYNLRYEFFVFEPNKKWVATLIFEGSTDYRKYRRRVVKPDVISF